MKCDKTLIYFSLFSYIFLILFTFVFPPNADAAFTRNLSVGMNGSDVLELQKTLNLNDFSKIALSGLGSPGQETMYFGDLTRQAVMRFQQKYAAEVLYPAGLTAPTGYVGTLTRAQLTKVSTVSIQTSAQKIIQNVNSSPSSAPTSITLPLSVPLSISTSDQSSANKSNAPHIYSMTPEKGKNGTTITLLGKNFTDKNTIYVTLDPVDEYIDIKATENGTKIVFKLNSAVANQFEENIEDLSKSAATAYRREYPGMPLAVSVANENGESNFLIYTLTVR